VTLAPGARPQASPHLRTPAVEDEFEPVEPTSLTVATMGGHVTVHLQADGRDDAAARANRRVLARIERWAERLTRHTDTSDLALLNADPQPEVVVRPTVAAALRAGILASDFSEGYADITLLRARLEAEGTADGAESSRLGEWRMSRRHRGAAVVHRPPGVRFDLGGIGKGWIADRALALLSGWPSALVDADGDLAVRCAPGKFWDVAIDDPRVPDSQLALLRLGSRRGGAPTTWGVATSGTSVHRWNVGGTVRHHLIDPRTGRPAVTDVIQATVIAGSALRAEALSKAAVIAGSVKGFALLDRARVRGAVLLTSSGAVLALPDTLRLLAG
jgi:thiamine biosynthesis lipoprotein